MASVLLLLPDEMLAEIDAIRPDGPRLEWIREALSSKLTMAQNQARVREEQIRIADESDRRRREADERNNAAALAALARGRDPASAGSPRTIRTVVRQGTLPGGAVCAHPFRDDQDVCRNCGQRR
jgi:hypothetical protein